MTDESQNQSTQPVRGKENEALLTDYVLLSMEGTDMDQTTRERYQEMGDEILRRMEEGGGESLND